MVSREEATAQHIPAKLNLTADFLSMFLRDRTGWILNSDIFAALSKYWGPLQVPGFSSAPEISSWMTDPDAEATDAFSQPWSLIRGGGVAHPPWCLVSQIVHKDQVERVTLVVIAPLWKTQAWFPVVMEMLMDQLILLPEMDDIVTPSPNYGCPVQTAIPRLVAWKFSGDSSRRAIPEKDGELILASWWHKTNTKYNSSWKW